MEDIDKNEVSDNGISEDEDLMMREVTLIYVICTTISRKSSEKGIIFKG